MSKTWTIYNLLILFGFCSAKKNDYVKPTTGTFDDVDDMCSGLENHDVQSFMNQVTGSFQYSCDRLQNAQPTEYQSLFNVVLTMAGKKVSLPTRDSASLCVTFEETIYLMEFMVNRTGREALKSTQKYRKMYRDVNDGEHYDQHARDVLCVGVNYRYQEAVDKFEKNKLFCDWIAKLYFGNGTLKRPFKPHKVILTCS